ncbi:MAG: 2-hydroxyacid dehydrogenase [Patescibacteria group bacterium]
MKLQRLVCLGFSGSELEDSYWGEIDALVESREIVSELRSPDIATEDGLLVKLGAKVGKDSIDAMPKLKYIGMLGTGYGGIDTAYAASKGITVTNIADYATEAVSEFTFGILLEYYRDIAKARSQAKSGNYSDDFSGGEIKGKKFGVVGLGDIGKRTAQLAQAFGADVCYWSRNRKQDVEATGIKYVDLDELIKTCDIITINLAYNSETEDIVNAERINSFKKHSIVINPSPMELFDFGALLTRLQKDDMVLMLDHSDEMTEEQLKTLQPLKHVIVYPAIGYITSEASALKKRIYVDNLKNFLAGQPTNKVN